MNVMDWFLNGALLGQARGYDRTKTGRPYGFDEFNEDIKKASSSISTIGKTVKELSSLCKK